MKDNPNEIYYDRFKKMDDDEKIEMFLNKEFPEKAVMDDEYKFRHIIELTHFEDLYSLYVTEGLYTETQQEKGTLYSSTGKLSDVLRVGGWQKYLQKIREAEERRVLLEKSAISTNKFQRIIAALSITFIIINTGFVALNFTESKKAGREQRIERMTIQALQLELTNQKMQLRLIRDYIAFQKSLSLRDSIMKKETERTVLKALKIISK